MSYLVTNPGDRFSHYKAHFMVWFPMLFEEVGVAHNNDNNKDFISKG